MDKRFDAISMNGRMAYIIMCVETFLITNYPNKNWKFVLEKMWKATSTNWDDFSQDYSSIIPDVLFQYDDYDKEEFQSSLSEQEFMMMKEFYDGMTQGMEDDPNDIVNIMLNKPFEFCMVYEGTSIGDGQESIDIIKETESILIKYHVPLPDYTKVSFSSIDELNGWGNDFDGRFLSSVLK